MPSPRRSTSRGDLVAVILAVSMGLAINVFIIIAGLEAREGVVALPIGLSDNATQVLTGWGGGIIGIIGALVGYHQGQKHPAEPPELN